MRKKQKTSFTLSDTALDLLNQIAAKMGISKTAALEIIIRDRAKLENIVQK